MSQVASQAAKPAGTAQSGSAAGRFLVVPIIILILAQMGATGDNGALSLAATALTTDLGATTAQIQLANMIYPLVGGAFMIAGGLGGTILGWKRTFRAGILLCALGEVAAALAPTMDIFIWCARVLVGLGASFMIPSSSASSRSSITAPIVSSPLAPLARRPGFRRCCRLRSASSWRSPACT